MTKHFALFIATVSLLSSTIAAAAADQSTPPAADQVQVAEAIRSFFAAATADDLEKLHAVTAPDFYAFDAGGRFTRDALMEMIKAAHAAGKVYVWTVNEPEVHISGDIAWITYVNHGSIKDASGTKDVTWLESAVLQKEKGTWRIHFFHSTRAPEKN
ncbi:MAG TPA: nuclear transport factor 2 family protein [Pyrinomonadaceae bacterium]